MIAAVFLVLCLIMAIARDTVLGRALHRVMVEQPATALNQIKPSHVIVTVMQFWR